ncbi:phosphoribosyltransferase [Methylococcus capsulatus]|nr:phosphoribosyltransferase [Methylococcus capsulatus]QXP95234.1 phosphoribosyltransferase [Methylococcus capsulatus]
MMGGPPTMSDPFLRGELVTWSQVYRLSRRLAENIRASGYRPDAVVAIARGGYVPARLLCDALGVYDLQSIRIGHYEGGARKNETARCYSPPPANVRGLKVLLTDDCSDTGDTLRLALEQLRCCGPLDIKIAVLHHKKVSPLVPDYYGRRIVSWRWLIYPWALTEDLSGFIAAMQPRPETLDEAVRQLRARHGIKPPRSAVAYVLALMKQREAP